MVELINGDCLEKMQLIKDNSIDMVLCDLPYGTTACKWDSVLPIDELWKQYQRIVKKGGAIILFGSQPFTSMLISSNVRNFRFSWVWNKMFAGNYMLARYQPMKIHEDIVVFSFGRAPSFYPQETLRSKIIKKGDNRRFGEHLGPIKPHKELDNKVYTTKKPQSIVTFSSRLETRYHPTQKPVHLLEYMIKSYSREGDVVLDNTMGSGSVGVACINTGRRFIGIEKDIKYFNIAERRIKDAIQQPRLFN